MAEGVEWSDGTVALRWRDRWSTTSAWDGGLDAVLAVHGHGGSTFVRWLTAPLLRASSGDAPIEAGSGVELAATEIIGVRVPSATADGRCSHCGLVWPCLSCGP